MLSLKRRHYFISYTLGIVHLATCLSEWERYLITLQFIILILKSNREGFRVNIFFYMLSALAYLAGLKSVSVLLILGYLYLAIRLVNYELPDQGSPVGYLHFKGGWLAEYQRLPEMAIFYPADKEDVKHRKLGVKWLQVRDYASRMDDTAKKDVRNPSRVPYLFFKIICTQFYRFTMYVYQGAKIDSTFGELDTQAGQIKYQVTILSHGLASHCNGYSVVARYLAQNGHIVIVPEHIEKIRNIYYEHEKNRVYRQGQLADRIVTIKSVLDIIYNQGRFDQFFQLDNLKVTPDYQEISILGHSFGGTVALEAAFQEKRITGACIMYDPCVYVFPDDYKIKLHIPLMSINADDFYERLYTFMENDARLERIFQQIDGPIRDHCVSLYILDQQHADFSDIPIIWNGEAGLYSISKNVHEVHLRFGMILWLTKLFLAESKKYHRIKDKKKDSVGNQELKEVILKELISQFGEKEARFIRWQQKK